MSPFKSQPTRTSFPIDLYRIDVPVNGFGGLVEFTAKEYDAVGGRAFEGERNYNTPDVEFRGRRWGVKLQTVYGRISKIVLHAAFGNMHEANPVAMDMLDYCNEKLGKTAEQQTGIFIWDTTDGNVNLVTGETVGGFEIILSLSAFDRLNGALLLTAETDDAPVIVAQSPSRVQSGDDDKDEVYCTYCGDHIDRLGQEPTEEDLAWVAFDFSAVPTVMAIDAELREAFLMVDEIKARSRAAIVPIVKRMAPTLSAETRATLKMDEAGNIPAGFTFKTAYRGGIEVATAKAPKTQQSIRG
jgi:hypothetical protein